MAGVVDTLTGKSAKKAEKAQKLAKQQADVANSRQLSQNFADAARKGAVRQNARGRRLYADSAASGLPSVVA